MKLRARVVAVKALSKYKQRADEVLFENACSHIRQWY